MFDGIMAFPEIYINGQLAGEWDYGYSSFYLDITDLVKKEGLNSIALRVDTRKFDSRWYPGAGIYRKVQLLLTTPVHHSIWGTQVQTPVIHSDSALIHIYNRIDNQLENHQRAEIIYEIVDKEGKVVATHSGNIDLPATVETEIEAWMTIRDPFIWDVEHPDLYTLKSILYIDGLRTEIVSTKFGIRTFSFDADDGFWLNG